MCGVTYVARARLEELRMVAPIRHMLTNNEKEVTEMKTMTKKLVMCSQCGKPMRIEETATVAEEQNVRCTPCRIKLIFK